MANIKSLLIALWVFSFASFVRAASVRGDTVQATRHNEKGRKRKLFVYPPATAPTISPQLDSTLTVMLTSPNQNYDGNYEIATNTKNKSTPAPTLSPTRYHKERRSDEKSKSKSTSPPTAFPTASPSSVPTASPTRRDKKNKGNEKKNIESASRSFPTASPSTMSSSLSNSNSYSVMPTSSRTEVPVPVFSTASPTQVLLSENDIDTENEETTKDPKSAGQVSISVVKEPPPPTENPTTTVNSGSASEKQPSDDSDDISNANYNRISLKSFHVQLTAKESWKSEYDPLVQHALERYLKNSMSLRNIQVRNVTLTTITSPSNDDHETSALNATILFRFKGHLYMRPMEENNPLDNSVQDDVWKQQSIALANHLLVQLNLDNNAILAMARVILVEVEFPEDDKEESSNTHTTNNVDDKARLSQAGRKALTVIGLIVAFFMAMGIGVWCISPFDGSDHDDDGSYFGKPRESLSQAATDEIRVDHDEIQSVTSSLTGAPREDEDENGMEDDIYLKEFVPESTTNSDHRLPLHAEDDDDQDSFYSSVNHSYFYKATGAATSSSPFVDLSSIETSSIYSVWKDPERKQQYESLRQSTNIYNNNDDEHERRTQIRTSNLRQNDESSISTNSMFITREERTTTNESILSLPAAPSLTANAQMTPPLPRPSRLSLSESLRLRIASHLAKEELFND